MKLVNALRNFSLATHLVPALDFIPRLRLTPSCRDRTPRTTSSPDSTSASYISSPAKAYSVQAILKVHTRTVPLGADADLAQVASATPGMVGADLRNLVNEAALLAARRGEDAVL